MNIIKKLNVPKIILRYIFDKFFWFEYDKKIILTIKEMNVSNYYNKEFLFNAKNDIFVIFSWLN